MIGMVLITHGRLAEELVAALEHVVGPQPNVIAVCIGPDDDMEQRRAEILDSAAKADEGDGVVLLTDMFGGTPSNLAISILAAGKGDRAQRQKNVHGESLETVDNISSAVVRSN